MTERKRRTTTKGKAARAFGRSLADFPNLTPAEKKLLDHCRRGEMLWLADERPEKGTPENTIRPGLIRFLLLGGDADNPLHEKGVRLSGAWIAAVQANDGENLDLENDTTQHALYLDSCVLKGHVILRRAHMPSLNLVSCHFPGLNADGLRCSSSVLFRAVNCDAGVRLVNAEIEGDLSLSDSIFKNPVGNAVHCDRVNVKGSVFLNKNFSAEGTVRLLAAKIGGDLVFLNASLQNPSGQALICDGAKVEGAIFWHSLKACHGAVSFNSVQAGILLDDTNDKVRPMLLDGFIYRRFGGGAPCDAENRISWLKRQLQDHLFNDFKPQPWEQCIKVLRDMGHEDDARAVAVEKQRMLFAANKVGGFPQRQLHWLYGLLAGYGYEPLRTVMAMALVWLVAATAFDMAGDLGLMGPNSPIVSSNQILNENCGNGDGFRETMWTVCPSLPQEYTTFNSWLYSLDLILPLVNLQQEGDWAPIVMKDDGVTNIWQGHVFRALMWFEILFGWAMSLLLVAVLGNLVKKD